MEAIIIQIVTILILSFVGHYQGQNMQIAVGFGTVVGYIVQFHVEWRRSNLK